MENRGRSLSGKDVFVGRAAAVDGDDAGEKFCAFGFDLMRRAGVDDYHVARRKVVVVAFDLDGHAAFQNHVDFRGREVSVAMLRGVLVEDGDFGVAGRLDGARAAVGGRLPDAIGRPGFAVGVDFGDEYLPRTASARVERGVFSRRVERDEERGWFVHKSPPEKA